jgi:hypothetical protein
MGIEYFQISVLETIASPDTAHSVRALIQDGKVGLVKNFISRELALQIRDYLAQIGRNSLPTYEPIEIGRPNFHRLNKDDERAHVRGCFHQFVFYPWNQDVFELFTLFKQLFMLKNVLSGNPPDRYLDRYGENGVVSRLAFQFYPAGKGFLNKHQDPFGDHQLTVPTVCLSQKSRDFVSGGAFVEDSNGHRHYLDDATEIGDVVFFDARLVHGVEIIDQGASGSWLDFTGRWTCLIATNKVVANNQIADAIDLEK